MDFKNVLTPRGFLSLGGVVLVLVGVLGFLGVIGPTAQQSLFGDAWWFDNAENVAHTVLGVVALLAPMVVKQDNMLKWLVTVVGLVGLLVGLYNFTSTQLLGANLESPADLVLHLVVGAWGLAAGLMPRKTA